MKLASFISMFLFAAVASSGQGYVSNLSEFSPFALDPSAGGWGDNPWVSASNRVVGLTPELNIHDRQISMNYPLRQKDKVFGAVGLYGARKIAPATDEVDVIRAGISLACRLKIARYSFASFGIQPEFSSTKISMGHVTTGSQWIQSELRFDPQADPGEFFSGNPVSFFSVNAGIHFYRIDKEWGTKDITLGVAAFHLNRPDLYGGSRERIPMTLLSHGSIAIHRSRKYKLEPGFTFYHFAGGAVIDLRLANYIYFENGNPYDLIGSGDVQLTCRVRPKTELSFGITFHQPGLALGFAYTIPIRDPDHPVYFQNCFEVSVMLTKNRRA